MRRIYACIAIVAAVIFLAYYNTSQIHKFVHEISGVLYEAEQAIEQEDYPAALRVMRHGAEQCRDIRHHMETILRTEDFTELEAYLRAACGYLEQEALDDTMGELRRAAVEVERLDRLSRRLL